MAWPLGAAGRQTARIARFSPGPEAITQAMTDQAPTIRLERDEHSVEVAHMSAAPRPPSTAITRRYGLSLRGAGAQQLQALAGYGI